jgi:hypothetical protein
LMPFVQRATTVSPVIAPSLLVHSFARLSSSAAAADPVLHTIGSRDAGRTGGKHPDPRP